ncbi:GNAT family N-acetyltransferase [Leifsonia kafniensis]|uniref:GNAT family N-acetyltransferase n=1 Tax=Leifsonia kafniensis TaxID=475957 RepID=A0ABP7KS91_9MICO
MNLTITIESPRQSEVETLVELSADFAQALYPPETNFLLGVEKLDRSDVSVYLARDDSARALGMAALVLSTSADETATGAAHGAADGAAHGAATVIAELKSLFVHPDGRGQGVAAELLDRIETDARDAGAVELVLETGPLHSAALRLYRKRGFHEIPLFGEYVGATQSLCFAKPL